MNPALTNVFINDTLGFDLENANNESYSHPSQIINRIWRLVGKTYDKRESDSHSICSYLNY
jgi:hypothetical protein